MRGSRYTIIFATALSAICSIVLSGVYMLLKDRQDENRALEQQMSILQAAQIDVSSKAEAKNIYEARVRALVVNLKGDVMTDIDPATVDENTKDLALLFAIAEPEDRDNISGYVYPIVGAGLWSKLYGYLAVDKTGQKILGITFYKQGETPGLGAEIEKTWFTNSFKGKTLFDAGKLTGVKVAKGSAKLDPTYKYNSDRLVDGISGATITGDGVTAMLIKDPRRYEAFFKQKREDG